ncbi:LacI family DNA-binding transcriptional regulator [Asticcacaulis solisilvae]|uniref:LacI family DNA-binding transcriptional regulator n=1 Tax=Asticcacaulis solisilvae TaxID=1217274 RepID=UPI003FD8A6C1
MATPTIKQVAQLAGVSIATVSRCLNEPDRAGKKTLARVREAVAELGYTPNLLAQNFRRGRTNIVMVVVPQIGLPLFEDVLNGIKTVLGGRYSLVITEANVDSQKSSNFIDMLVSRQVEGVILLASLLPFSPQLIAANQTQPLPLVVGLEPLTDDLEKLPSVHIDNYQAALEATRYLVDLGHTRIAFVSGAANSLITGDRERGFRAAMAEANIAVAPALVQYSDLTITGGGIAAQHLLRMTDRPTAIFCANDDMALGVMSSARRMKIDVPGQLSVMGFDDTCYAEISNPALSTVHQPARDIGVRVAQRLLQEMETPDHESLRVETLPHKLVIRESTRRPMA